MTPRSLQCALDSLITLSLRPYTFPVRLSVHSQCAVAAFCVLSVQPSSCPCALTMLSIHFQLDHWACVACINRASCDLRGSVYFLSSLCMHHAQKVFCQEREGSRQGSRKASVSSKVSITVSTVAQSSPSEPAHSSHEEDSPQENSAAESSSRDASPASLPKPRRPRRPQTLLWQRRKPWPSGYMKMNPCITRNLTVIKTNKGRINSGMTRQQRWGRPVRCC